METEQTTAPVPVLRVELRKVQFSERMSEETNCFICDVWVDGVKAGTAQNHGTGGNTDIFPRDLRERLDTYAATLPPETYEAGGETVSYPHTGESLIDKLLADHLSLKRLRRLCSKQTLFRRNGQEYDEATGEWLVLKRPFTEAIKCILLAKYPEGLTFANELPGIAKA